MIQKRANTITRQRQILSSARKLIVKYGSEHVTVRRIAKGIGVSEGAIYRHFKSKRDILSLLVDDIENDLVDDISRVKSSNQPSLQMVDAILRGHLSAIEQRRGISFQVIAEIISFGDKKLNTKVAALINKYISLFKELLARGVAAGEVREDIDLEIAATSLFAIIQGIVNIWSLSNYSFDLEGRSAPLWNIFREAIIKR